MKDILLVFSLWCAVAIYAVVSRPTNGLDIPALQYEKLDIEYLKQHLPGRSAIGFIDGTFGKSLDKLVSLLSSTPVDLVRVHLFSGSGLRAGVAQSYELTHGYTIRSWDRAIRRKNRTILGYVQSRTRRLKSVAASFPNTTFCISPEAEHNLSVEAYRILANVVLRTWPGVCLVNNAQSGNGERYRGALRESHHAESGSHVKIASMDGLINVNPDLWFKRNQYKLVRFFWTPSFNCRTKNEEKFIPPRSRPAENCPTSRDYEDAIHIIKTH